ncbi:MAG: hypothetical protein H6667_22685 [Ardenticatenaceae bacterium]|nr:hypothetical protein [Ardenticatenaceae bacterium]
MEATGLNSQTIRITFSIAGQAVALKVMGSSTNTYYLYNDHASTLLSTGLGSVATMSTTGGGTVAGSNGRYTPFGDRRTTIR